MSAKLCLVVSCTGVKAAVNSCYSVELKQAAIPSIHVIVVSISRKAMGYVLKPAFILDNSTTKRWLHSQGPLFMRHYLIL